MFAGQGAQVPGMGKDFAEADTEAMALFDKANAVLGFDLKKICFEGPAEELTKSNICQPAIFVTSYAAYLALQKRRPTEFACAAGLSLGEWGALCAAGVLDFDSTLKVLEARGRFMQEACEATPSGMIAIVGATPEQLNALCEKTGCTVANINSAAQQVLSGSKDAIAAAATVAKELGIKRAIPLATAGGFHSKFMQPAREKLAPILDGIAFSAPKFPVLSWHDELGGGCRGGKGTRLRLVRRVRPWQGALRAREEDRSCARHDERRRPRVARRDRRRARLTTNH